MKIVEYHYRASENEYRVGRAETRSRPIGQSLDQLFDEVRMFRRPAVPEQSAEKQPTV